MARGVEPPETARVNRPVCWTLSKAADTTRSAPVPAKEYASSFMIISFLSGIVLPELQ
jgi:hypothetical protein